ncbi:MAG: gamma carbonic anhydrase family protein [Alphaproteobacteria bacterium]|nr:gamma carbonic anhydrase family protein [Alphaproteobacteria bacterium]
MLLEHDAARPSVHPTARIAPTAVLCGDVTVGPDSSVGFGAVLTAETGPIEVGAQCVIMENAVLRGTSRHPLRIGDNVLIGPNAYLSGASVGDNSFIATGVSVFNAARIGARAMVRIGAVVHIKTVLADDAIVPIGWVAVGDPARILPPDRHEEIWEIQKTLDFPGTVFGVGRADVGESYMPEAMRRYTKALARHRGDRVLENGASRPDGS